MSEVTSSSSTSTALLPNATAASAAAAITATSIASIDSQPEVQVKSNHSGSVGVLGPPCRINDLGEIISGSTAHPIIEASREAPLRPSSAPFDPYFASATTASPSNSFSVPLRKGKWTPEEEAFTTCIINDFTKGFFLSRRVPPCDRTCRRNSTGEIRVTRNQNPSRGGAAALRGGFLNSN